MPPPREPPPPPDKPPGSAPGARTRSGRPASEQTAILYRSRPKRLDEIPGFTSSDLPAGDGDPATAAFDAPLALIALPSDRRLQAPSTLRAGHYALGEVLGEGGMGLIYAAQDVDLGRTVALKALREQHRQSPAYIRALVFEARLTGQLEHPNIVPVHELGRLPDGSPYYTMKLVGELSLQDVLRQLAEGRPLAVKYYTQTRLLQFFRGICMAVEFAHARGVIHRDLKPDNVLIGDYGEVQILDWGVARVLPQGDRPAYFAGRPEVPGVVIGTPHYMSPEQARGDTHLVDIRSDVYALGVILYQLLTHTLPFVRESTIEQLDALLSEPIIPPSERAPSLRIPPKLEAICLRALAPQRADRFPSARSLWDAIEEFLEGEREHERLQLLADDLTHSAEHASDRYYRASAELLTIEANVSQDDLNARHIAPLDIKKASWERRLHADERRMAEARLFAEAVTGFQQALAYVPGHPRARHHLVDLYRHRTQLARLRGQVGDLILYSDLARAVEPPPPGALGTVSVRTYPEGAALRILKFQRDHAACVVTTTAPSFDIPLEPGSYLISATLPGHAERRQPVVVEANSAEQLLLSLARWDSALPVIARGDDLTAIREAFNAVVAERRLSSFMVTGEAGLGKRKLLDEFCAWLDELTQLVTYGAVHLDTLHEHVPFHALTTLLAHRAGINRSDAPETVTAKLHDMVRRPWLGSSAGPDETLPDGVERDLARQAALLARLPQFRSTADVLSSAPDDEATTLEPTLAVFGAVAAYLRKIAETTPIVLAFRGAEHLDRLSRDLLFFLAAELAETPLFCLMFARDDTLQLRCDQTLRLLPLDRDRIRQQLALLLRGPVADDALDQINRISQGNSFQVAELTRLLVQRELLTHDGRHWRLDAGSLSDVQQIEDLFAEPLTRLTPPAAALLSAASAQGATFWDAAIALQPAPPTAPDRAALLDELLAASLITQQPTSRFSGTREFTFRHDALQRRLARALSPAQSRHAHLTMAHFILETAPHGAGRLADLALAAHHAECAGDHAFAEPLRAMLADEASRWEHPERGLPWFEWPASLASAVFDL